MQSQKTFVEYYEKLGFTPVRQGAMDRDAHFAKRRALYNSLGLPSLAFRDARVLEFGPGPGDNALYIDSLKPSDYCLVDGSSTSIKAIQEKLDNGQLDKSRCHISQSLIKNYPEGEEYDIVLCEALIPNQEDSAGTLRHVASFAGKDGVVVSTTQSQLSYLSEILRRLVKPVFARKFDDFKELTGALTQFFTPDLDSLKGMSRRYDDWVLDTILNEGNENMAFSLRHAVEAIGEEFTVLGTSPSFSQDWRWYKAIPIDERPQNQAFLDSLDLWALMLIDYRIDPNQRTPDQKITLRAETLGDDILKRQVDIWHGDRVEELPTILETVSELSRTIRPILPETSDSLTDFVTGMARLIDGDLSADFGSFRPWFGRGMQYVSFIRS